MRDEDGEEIRTEVGTIGALALPESVALDRAAIDMQVATAKQYPRSITKALQEAEELATLDEETAGSCFYTLPKRKGQDKAIEGPSARLAEIMAYSWGNLRAESSVIGEDRTHVTAQSTCFDLEKNVAVRIQVKRRITTKDGKRYGDDMIGVTGNAAVSIALRNAVFKVIPSAFSRRIYQAARQASIGKAGTLDTKRQAAMEWFGKAGIKPEQVYALLEIAGWDDLGAEEIIQLRGTANAIRDGETTLEQVFNPSKSTEGASSLDAALEAAAKAKGAEPEKPQPVAAQPEPPKPEPEKPKERKARAEKAPDATKAPEVEDVVGEAYAKASRKATALAKAGALDMKLSEDLDAARDAGSLDDLIKLDTEFTRLATVHGIKLP